MGLIELCDKIMITLWASSPKLKSKIGILLQLYAVSPRNIRTVI